MKRIDVGEVTLNVRTEGTGTAVLLLHGFPDNHRLWDEVAPRLVAGGHAVIAPDLRGFGESDAPVGSRHYDVDRIRADLEGLLDALGIVGPVHVMGHDWGAAVAWYLALVRPERVRSNVVISVGHPREYTLAGLKQKLKGRYMVYWQFRGLAEAALSRNGYAGLRHWLRTHPDPDSCVRDLARPGRLTAGLNWYRGNFPRVLAGSWPRCRVPTLGLWSTGDTFLAEDQMVRSTRRMDAPWEYERFEGAGHWLPLEQPARVATLALEWFARNG